tara:strand:- start:114 stop:824 length:711 start_codon:yes stop_codon:yes gene_type:complete
MLTVNDLIGLDYSNLRNPITLRQDINRNQPFLDIRNPQPEFFPNDQQGSLNVDMGATGTIPTESNINAQPLIDNTGISPILQQDMDYGTSIDNFQGFTDKQDFSRPPKKSGLAQLFQLAISAAIPGAGLILRGGQGLAGLNRRLRQSDFARATSLVDYFDAQKYGGIDARNRAALQNMREAKAIQKQLDLRTATGKYDDGGDRNRGQTPSAPKASKTSSPRQSRQTSGIGGLHSGY